MTNNFSNFQTQQGFQMPQFPNTNQPNTNNTQPMMAMSPITNIFPQPNGSVYILNSSNDMGNIPTTAGLSVGICLNENTLIIKSIQNGAPAQLVYKLVPASDVSNTDNNTTTDKSEIEGTLKSHKLKIESLERQIQRITEKVGGKLEWQM